MSVVYVTEDGSALRKTGERLLVSVNREQRLDVPMRQVEQIVLFGPASVSGRTVSELLDQRVGLTYLTKRGRYLGRLEPITSRNPLLRRSQYGAACDPERSAAVTEAIVRGKLVNQRALLQRAHRSNPDEAVKAAIESIRDEGKAVRADDGVEVIRGHEGAAAAAYFGVFDHLIRADGFTFGKRIRRPPTDPVNSLLSLGYTLLFGDVLSAVQTVGLDPCMGFLHDDRQGRPSLALDLMEEFRPLIVDSLVLTVINKHILGVDDFDTEIGGAVILCNDARKRFLVEYENRINTEVKHPQAGYRVTYRRACEIQARILGRHLMGELPNYVPLTTR
jgi:CRISP-associated protein Cas1